MTESCGMATILPPEMMSYGNVGVPAPSVEIKLRDVPDAGYLSTNNPPQGEILIRGPSVFSGYYKRDDLNKDPTIFSPDGFMRTGDVGQWNPNGTLTVIDRYACGLLPLSLPLPRSRIWLVNVTLWHCRVKNLVKLQGGEYVALEQLESVYRSCNLVSNICVLATPNAKQPIAVVIPNGSHLSHALGKVVDDNDLGVLCRDTRVKQLILKECNAVGKKGGFKPIQMLQAVVLTPNEWTPQNGFVTAAQKIQRRKIAEAFAVEIKVRGQCRMC